MSAIKKQQLYSSLWETCDNLRGGMEPTEYKNYILIFLFVKYISDKYKNKKYAEIKIPDGATFDDFIKLKGKKDIGEQINKKIHQIAKENDLMNVITTVSFNDDAKLGTGQAKVELLSNIIEIFERPEFDFKSNVATGDDILGDAYEYLMKKFASASGKVKGEFYTPAEVSRILASVLEVDKIKKSNLTCYDPACGSSSLLMKVASMAPEKYPIQIYGQENEVTTAGISKMNMVIHNFSTARLEVGDTFANPKYIDENTGSLKKFDYVVVNPPFSYKKWTMNLSYKERFEGFGAMPPNKNGDYAWLMHVLYSLKPNGKAAVILPPGVLSRGNAEGIIRKNIITGDKGCLIKGIIAFPQNVFMGTNIQAIALIIDKEDAKTRDSIFMIDASDGFTQDGNKNRLREKDIQKIVDTYINKIEIEHYSKNVSLKEIIEDNDCNLNIARYISKKDNEIVHNVLCHINGGIPISDIDNNEYFDIFKTIKKELLTKNENNTSYDLKCNKEDIRNIVRENKGVKGFLVDINDKCIIFNNYAKRKLKNVNKDTNIKELILELKNKIIDEFKEVLIIDKLDPYEIYMNYMNETMLDDLNIIVIDGFEAGANIYEEEKGKTKKWDGVLIPKTIIQNEYFAKELKELDDIKNKIEEKNSEIVDLFSEATEDSLLYELINENKEDNENNDNKETTDNELGIEERALKVKLKNVIDYIKSLVVDYEDDITKTLTGLLNTKVKKEKNDILDKNKDIKKLLNDDLKQANIKNKIYELKLNIAKKELGDDFDELIRLKNILVEKGDLNTELKEKTDLLDNETKNKYSKLTITEIQNILIDKKWLYCITNDIIKLSNDYIQNFATDIIDLSERYEDSLISLEKDLEKYEKETSKYLKEMGYEL